MARRIVVFGGEHGGAWVASKLKRRLRSSAEVIFISQQPEMVILPSLTAAIADDTAPRMMNFRHELAHLDIKVIIGTVKSHDPAQQRLFLDHGSVDYDILLVDPPMKLDFSDTPGSLNYAFPIRHRKDAHKLAKHIDMQLNRASIVDDDLALPLSTIVVSSSDVQGLQATFAIAHRVSRIPAEITPRIILCDTGFIGKTSGVREELKRLLEDAGVQIVSKTVKEVSPNEVSFSDDTTIPCNTVVWTGCWKPAELPIKDGSGVITMSAEPPFWPATGRSAAKNAATWVSAYLSGKPRPPKRKEGPILVHLPDEDIAVSDGISSGMLEDLRSWWIHRRFLHL